MCAHVKSPKSRNPVDEKFAIGDFQRLTRHLIDARTTTRNNYGNTGASFGGMTVPLPDDLTTLGSDSWFQIFTQRRALKQLVEIIVVQGQTLVQLYVFDNQGTHTIHGLRKARIRDKR